MPGMKQVPIIEPVRWLAAKEVLGGEASDFTPWLQKPDSMQILGDALKLEDLTAVAAEHNVLGKRLDILAQALDENGNEIPVCIENQYGMSDADHLGRLIAYLAQEGRGRAVWVVEQAHDAYVAAVRFLNRTSDAEVGYYLVQVRFTHGASGAYQVHFDVLAAPNAWERGKSPGGPRIVNQTKVSYLEGIHERVKPTLLGAGFPSLNTHIRGAYLWISWPKDLWFRRFAKRLDIKVNRASTFVAVWSRTFATRQANTEAVRVLKERYSERLAKSLPPGTEVEWFAGGSGRKEVVIARLPGAGYEGGDAEAASTWASAVVLAWLELLRSDPILDLEQQVGNILPEVSDDDDAEDDGN